MDPVEALEDTRDAAHIEIGRLRAMLQTSWVVVEVEPYGKVMQVEKVYGPFPHETDALGFVLEYAIFHGLHDNVARECLRVEKLAGTRP